jgi:hypoxanthine phosphoribosyltransferase
MSSVNELTAAVSEILIDEDTLQNRIGELGAEISEDYRGRDLLLIAVLKGAVFFMADLMRRIEVPCEVDFMAISSYGAGVDSSGVVRILKDLDISIEGRNVLVVEDIIDSGLTLSYLLRNLEAREPASLEICALLTKPAPRDRHSLPLHRLRDPEQVRDRLRPRLRRAVPKPPVCGRSQGRIGRPGRRADLT